MTLDGSASSDPNGEALTYAWLQTAGPAVTLSSTTAVKPTFSAPSPAGVTVLTFRLTVTDPRAGTSQDTVSITVSPLSNGVPVANAGPDQSVGEMVLVTLDGSASSDPDLDPLTYAWTQLSGPAETLSSTTAKKPTFTSPQVVAATMLTFQLVVNDSKVSSSPDTVVITVNNTVDEAPVANAGPDQSAGELVSVMLSGAASSDPNGQAVTYAWTQSSGPAVTLVGATTVSPSFTTPNVTTPQVIVLSLVVNDGQLSSPADTVAVTVNNTINEPPVANAGPDQSIGEGVTATLERHRARRTRTATPSPTRGCSRGPAGDAVERGDREPDLHDADGRLGRPS